MKANNKPSIVFVHWNADEAKQLSAPLKKRGWRVILEHGKGSLKLSQLKTHPPSAVVISLRRLPSHGKEFAGGLWGAKWGRSIPIVFFDGEVDKRKNIQKLFPAASFTTYDALLPELEKFAT